MSDEPKLPDLPPDLREAYEVLASGAAQILPADGLAEAPVGPAGQDLDGDRLGLGRADLLQVPALDPGRHRGEGVPEQVQVADHAVLVQLAPGHDHVEAVVVGVQLALGAGHGHLVQGPDGDAGADLVAGVHSLPPG